MILINGANQYTVGSLVAKSGSSNFYTCICGESQYFLQIAANTAQNAKLDLATYVLKNLKGASDIYEEEYRILYSGSRQLNYDWLFPTVVDSFIPDNQGSRMVNILAINTGDNLEQMVPLSNIYQKDHRIIDLATSIWMMGRILKLLVLAHDQFISLGLDSDNIIIEPKHHHVVILDWIDAKMYQDEVPEDVRKSDIANAASLILAAMGEGNEDSKGKYQDNPYVDFLKSLVEKSRSDTEQVYRDFESAHNKIFEETIFYPFTTYPL